MNLRSFLSCLSILMASVSFARSQPELDPVIDERKASEWVVVLQNDTSTRQRVLAITALVTAKEKHQFKDSVANIGRSLRVDSSAVVRARAAVAIAGFPPADAHLIGSEVVEAMAKEKDARVRKEIAITIGRFPELARKAVEPLTLALKDADAGIRCAAIEALSKAGTSAKGTAPELVNLLNDPEKSVRQAAAFAIGRVGSDNPSFVAAALVKRLGDEKEAELRREMLLSVKLIDDRAATIVAGLISSLSDPDDEVRAIAVRTLAGFGTAAAPAADALLKLATGANEKNARVDAVRAFGSTLGPALKNRLKDLVQLLDSDMDFEVRVAVVEEIGALGNELATDRETLTALRKKLSDPQVKVREAASAAIRRIEKKTEKSTSKKP